MAGCITVTVAVGGVEEPVRPSDETGVLLFHRWVLPQHVGQDIGHPTRLELVACTEVGDGLCENVGRRPARAAGPLEPAVADRLPEVVLHHRVADDVADPHVGAAAEAADARNTAANADHEAEADLGKAAAHVAGHDSSVGGAVLGGGGGHAITTLCSPMLPSEYALLSPGLAGRMWCSSSSIALAAAISRGRAETQPTV